MRRWICPTCGAGTNAPERPAKDDVRRYCFPCSTKNGKLVERTSPALEKQRAASREKSAAKTTNARQRATEARIVKVTVGPFNLEKEAARIWKVSTFREMRRWRKEVPPITFRRSQKWHSSGHANYYSRQIVVTIGTNPYDAAVTVLHELGHIAVGSEGHSSRFWSALRSAAKEAWPEVPWSFVDSPTRGWPSHMDMYSQLQKHYESR